MSSDVGMVIHGERVPEMFLEPFPKCPCRFSYLFLITLQPVTHVPLDFSTFICDIHTLGSAICEVIIGKYDISPQTWLHTSSQL